MMRRGWWSSLRRTTPCLASANGWGDGGLRYTTRRSRQVGKRGPARNDSRDPLRGTHVRREGEALDHALEHAGGVLAGDGIGAELILPIGGHEVIVGVGVGDVRAGHLLLGWGAGIGGKAGQRRLLQRLIG